MLIILGGDVMLGRLVKEAIKKYGIDFPMQAITPIFASGDVNIVNLECAITSHPHQWSGVTKAFYFSAPPEVAQILANSNIHCVNLANNHALDYNYQGLIDTFQYLKKANIKYTGAGKNLDEALQPAIIDCQNIKFGMVGFCDHQHDFAANENTPGIAYLNLDDQQTALAKIQQSLQKMLQAGVQYPMLSLHWGPNMVDHPTKQFIEIAHAVIDMGYKILFGHSAHTFHGIEIYRDCPIIYSAGDLVDDYAIDPYYRNDHQLLFAIELEELKLKRILLYPVFTDFCLVRPAVNEEFDWIGTRITELCREMGTVVSPYNSQSLIITTKN